MHHTNQPLNEVPKSQHILLFYKIRAKRESGTQSFCGVWVFAGTSEVQPGAI